MQHELQHEKNKPLISQGFQTVDKDLGIPPRIFLWKRLKVSIFKTF